MKTEIRHMKKNHCRKSFRQLLLQLIPILSWLPKYKWREDLLGDSVAGFTTAVLQVPQGLLTLTVFHLERKEQVLPIFEVDLWVIVCWSCHNSHRIKSIFHICSRKE